MCLFDCVFACLFACPFVCLFDCFFLGGGLCLFGLVFERSFVSLCVWLCVYVR